jgi:hypothetical protein
MPPKSVRVFSFFCVLTLFLWSFAQEEIDSSTLQIELSERQEGGILFLGAKARFPCSRSWIWRALVDYPNAPRYLPHTNSCQVQKIFWRSPQEQVFQVAYQLTVQFTEIHYILEIVHFLHQGEISWTLLSGNIKHTQGRWILKEQGQETLASYEVYTDPGRWVPPWLYKKMTEQSIQDIFKGVYRWAKYLEENQEKIPPPTPFIESSSALENARLLQLLCWLFVACFLRKQLAPSPLVF